MISQDYDDAAQRSNPMAPRAPSLLPNVPAFANDIIKLLPGDVAPAFITQQTVTK